MTSATTRTSTLPDDEQVYAFTRRLDQVELLVLANFSGRTVTADVPDAAGWARAELLIANYPPDSDRLSGELILRPWETRVYRRTG